MPRQIIGTKKFEVFFFNGKNIRSGIPAPAKRFVYRQWGRIYQLDENGKKIDNGKPFEDYGQMITFINKIMRKQTRVLR